MKKFMMFCLLIATSSLANEKPDAETHPIRGLLSIDLLHVLDVVSTNVPSSAVVNTVIADKDCVRVGTITTSNGVAVDGDDLILKCDGDHWKLAEKAKPLKKPFKAGVTVPELFTLVRGLPLGPKFLSIVVESERKIHLTTGYIGGPLDGSGEHFVFEKIDGIWKQTGKTHWVS